MRKNPARAAWTILGASFAVFCLLVSGIPLATRAYVLNSTTDEKARMQVIEGTVLVERASHPTGRVVRDVRSLRGSHVHYLSLLIVRGGRAMREDESPGGPYDRLTVQ